MKPRIGISTNYYRSPDGPERLYLDRHYFEYVQQFGGVALPIAPTEDVEQLQDVLDLLDGVMFTGGLDLDPDLWGEDPHPKSELLHPRRQLFEFMLYEYARQRKKPILGICLGMQVINVAHGGKLFQHLPDREGAVSITHSRREEPARHGVDLAPGSRLAQWLGLERIHVNSYHHQGVLEVGEGLTVSARSEDGVVEAIERPDYPFLIAVQWHPEREANNRANTILMQRFLEVAASPSPDSPTHPFQ